MRIVLTETFQSTVGKTVVRTSLTETEAIKRYKHDARHQDTTSTTDEAILNRFILIHKAKVE